MADGCRCPLGDNHPRQRDSSVNCNINWWINEKGRLIIKYMIWVPHIINWWINEKGRLIIKYMIWVPHMYPQFLEWAERTSQQLPDTANIALILRGRREVFRLPEAMAFIRQNFNAENIHKYSSDGARREFFEQARMIVQQVEEPEQEDKDDSSIEEDL